MTGIAKKSDNILHIIKYVSVLMIIMAYSVGAQAADTAEELGRIEADLEKVDGEIAQLRGRYVKPLLVEKSRNFEFRFDQAMFLYNDGDFVHASIIFTDLLSYSGVERQAQYYDLLFYLGAALAKNKNYTTARDLLEQVTRFGSDREHFKEAIIQLIHLSVDLGLFAEAEKYYNSMSGVGGGDGWDVIQYSFAKFLYRKGRLVKALESFRKIPSDSEKRLQADYFIGVILVEQGKLEEALEIFTRLGENSPQTDKEKDLLELSQLASARILFEIGRYDEGMSIYRLIPVTSKFFDQAYYEVTWIYIQKEKYTDAANTLDMLLLTMPDSIYAPDSLVLKGNVHLWEGRFPEANNSFQTVVNKYIGVVDEMDQLLEKTIGKEAETIQEMLFGESSRLPPVALAWLSEEQDVAAALAISRYLEVSKKDQEDAQRIIGALKLHLEQESKANLFPPLKEGRERGVAAAHELTAIRKELMAINNQLVGERLGESERENLEKSHARRRDLERAYEEIPKTVQERHERRAEQVKKMEKLGQDAYQLGLELKGINEVIDTIMKRHELLRGNPQMSQNYLKQVQQDVREFNEIAEEMKEEYDRLQREVSEGLEKAKIGDVSNRSDERIHRNLEKAIAEEKKLLDQMRSKLSSEEMSLFDRVQTAKYKSDQLDDGIQSFFRDMEAMVTERVADFSRQVEEEEQVVAGYTMELAKLKSKAERIAAEIAYKNLQIVRDRFYSIYLKANVGIIDIAWERRQKVHEKITGLLDQRSEEKSQLDRSFEGLR